MATSKNSLCGSSMEIISVSSLNTYVKSILDDDKFLCDIAVRAEVASFKCHQKSGHCYFYLKDEKCSVAAVMFSQYTKMLSFVPECGMQIIARARATIFQKEATFQLYVTHMFLDGAGAAAMAFEQLKTRLNNDGLFSSEHKKALPPFPQKIGLVTSRDGAAVYDILSVAKRLVASFEFVIADVPVQGAAAAPKIAEAINALDNEPLIDIIIVARGGGSSEDLFVFNSEIISRAAFNCKTPIVSAIGHEIDETILDLVADVRAATPTAAAQIVLSSVSQYYLKYKELKEIDLGGLLQLCIKRGEDRLSSAKKQLGINTVNLFRDKKKLLNQCILRFSPYNPKSLMQKGYAVVRSQGRIITDTIPKKGSKINVMLEKVTIDCTVDDIHKIEETDERVTI